VSTQPIGEVHLDEANCKAWPIASAMRPKKTRMLRVPLATWTTTIDIAWHGMTQTGSAPTFHLQSTRGLQYQPESGGLSVAELIVHLSTSGTFDKRLPYITPIKIAPKSCGSYPRAPEQLLVKTTSLCMRQRSYSFGNIATRPMNSRRVIMFSHRTI
jgi:hypothetical protein